MNGIVVSSSSGLITSNVDLNVYEGRLVPNQPQRSLKANLNMDGDAFQKERLKRHGVSWILLYTIYFVFYSCLLIFNFFSRFSAKVK